VGLPLTAQENASKEVVYGNFIYPKKVYLYWQVSMKIAGTALSMQTMLELDRQMCFKIHGLFFHNNMISKQISY